MNLCRVGPVKFPEPMGISINMMPFIMGYRLSLPDEYRHYWPLVEACGLEDAQHGKVGYLSIMEGVVRSGQTQRRPGLHTDKHPDVGWGGGWGSNGERHAGSTRSDGIYLASNIDSSCRAWNVYVDEPGPMGDCEHLRKILTPELATVLDPNVIYWMTDSCPHESLSIPRQVHRQWFRVVTHKVGLWYARHSTPNRLGVKAPCPIVQQDKFAEVSS